MLITFMALPPPLSLPLSTKTTPWPQRSQTLLPSPLHRPARPPLAGAKGFGGPTAGEKAKSSGSKSKVDIGDDETKTEEDAEDEIPQEVFERMVVRILSWVGGPIGVGVGLIYVLGVVQERGVWEVPQWVPFFVALVSFGTSALGIAYGTLSTSWDPEKEGSLLGWEEAKKNWPELWKEEENQR